MMRNDLGILLRRIREERGRLQADIAKAAGISPAQLSRIEGGKNTGVDVIRSLAAALDHEVVLQPREADGMPDLQSLTPADRQAVATFIRALPRLTERERAVWMYELELVAAG